MLAGILAVLGAVYGWWRAGRLGGKPIDRLQFATVFAIVGFLLGLFGTLLLDWAGLLDWVRAG